MITLVMETSTLKALTDDEETYLLFSVKDEGNGYERWTEAGVAGSETDIEEMCPEFGRWGLVRVVHQDSARQMPAVVKELVQHWLKNVDVFSEMTDDEQRIVGTPKMFAQLMKTFVNVPSAPAPVDVDEPKPVLTCEFHCLHCRHDHHKCGRRHVLLGSLDCVHCAANAARAESQQAGRS